MNRGMKIPAMQPTAFAFILLLLSAAHVDSVNLAADQIPILVELYSYLGPSSPTVLPSWNANNTVCEKWIGLTCNAKGKVIEIYLSTEFTRLLNGTILPANLVVPQGTLLFSGKISPIVGSLTFLESLTLASLGAVAGAIPATLGNLPALKLLNLSGNVLSGPIPATLGNNALLEVIDLHANQYLDSNNVLISAIDGIIPATLSKLKLKLFDIGQNGFGGIMPSFFLNQASLEYLSIQENNFFGSLGSFLPSTTTLSYLSLSFCGFASELDPVIGNLTGLQYLDLGANFFSGPIPNFIGNLVNLTYLNVGGNQFTLIPNSFSLLQSLEYFNAAYNFLDGPFPQTLENAVNLKHLILSGNGLTGPFDVSYLTHLQELDLSVNSFSLPTGIPDYFGNLTSLQYLDLSYNKFSGGISETLGNIKNLSAVSCNACNLTGSIPSTLGSINAVRMSFASNFLTGSIPIALCNLTSVVTLDLSNNQLNGTIPDCFGTNLTSLETLWLFNNSLTGVIPQSFATAPCLLSVQLQSNALNGEIPAFGTGSTCASSGRPSNEGLNEIILSNNTLDGDAFPAGFNNLTALQTLSLSYNYFNRGSLSSEIGQLSQLLIFECRGCNLLGQLPVELMQLDLLTNLDLSANSFTGSLPLHFFSNFTAIESISIAGSSLSGSIPSLTGLDTLLSLDLSFNQLSSVLVPSALPASLVTLNLEGNQLTGNLTTNSFSTLRSLDILQLGSNNGISGTVPVLSASVVSFANTSLTGPVPATYLKSNSSTVSLYLTPACDVLEANTKAVPTVCLRPKVTNVFQAAAICANTTCLGTNLPNPYYLSVTSTCLCADYNVTSLTLVLSPFFVLTPVAANIVQTSLADKLNIAASRLRVESATTYSDGRTVMQLFLFGTAQARDDASLSKFFGIWSKKNLRSTHYLTVTGLGLIDTPKLVEIIEFVPSSSLSPIPTAVSAPVAGSSSVSSWVWATGGVAGFLLGLLLILTLALVVYINIHKPSDVSDNDGVIEPKPYYVPRIPIADIETATDNFSEDKKLGSGGYGDVFKGISTEGTIWAVKRAKAVTEKSLAEFENELDILSKVSHTNVVKLLGYCDTKAEQILVYEFMNSGTLKHKLSFDGGDSKTNPLSLAERVEVALGAAEGLRYLHSHAERTIIHRDIKSENILLNSLPSGYQSKIADFGLLKDNAEGSAEFMNTRVAGTMGYIDPEYYNYLKVTRKSDVYSFGVVLLELITGLSALIKDDTASDPDEPNITSLANWVQPFMDDVSKMVDPRLGSDYNLEAMEQFVKLAKSCTERYGKYRPLMDEVCFRLIKIRNTLQGKEDETVGEESSVSSVPTPFSDLSSSVNQSNVIVPLSQAFTGR